MAKRKTAKKSTGRPTGYSRSIITKAKYYLANYSKLGDEVPQISGLALHLGVHRDTLYEWAKDEKKKTFSDIFEQVKAKQENVLVNNGLLGKYNSAITKMMLTKHGYSDKLETEGGGGVTTLIFRGDDAKL